MIVTPFARRIKHLRAGKGFSVRDLAAAIGKSPAYMAKIETQGEIPTPQLTSELAKLLDVDPVELLQLAKTARLSSASREIEREYSRAVAMQELVDKQELADDREKRGASKMTKVMSLINMKGGVGKTTLAMQLAHSAASKKLRTLAVDLDPQSNLSQALMGPRQYVKHLDTKKPTIVQIFDDYVPTDARSGSPRRLDVDEVLVKGAGPWASKELDLIPSRLELSRTLKNPTGKERRLAKALAQIRGRYDIIIIDCAPTESVLTDAAYFASRYIVAPIKPEFMATIGLPLLARSLQEFRLENDDHQIEIAGLAFNHSSSYSAGPEGQQSIEDVTKEAKKHGWYIFENQVRYSASYAKSAREGTPLSWTSYARGDVVEGFRRFADEVFEQIGIVEVPA
ncbi:MAG: AAA family ATPase [Hyphomicrobium sp.]|uniref:AAA family ATPase n=1 Tax=Hyphomicrobium sp. TaxID=82 RepID=UPI003D099C69